MSVPRSLALAAAIVLGLSTLADAAPRARYRGEAAYGAQGAASARPATGSYAGYSADPKRRELEQLADKYRPGW